MPDHAGVAFLPARPVTPAGLATLTERVRRRFLRWLLRTRLLDAEAAADMLAWENSGFSVDASVRIAMVDRDVPSYFRSLEHWRSPTLPLSLSLRDGAGVRVPPMPRAVPTTLRQSHGPGSSREKAEAFPLACPACGGDIRLIAFITDPAPIRKILLHLGEPLEPTPLAPARGPPTSWDELVQVHDDRDAIQASPDDLLVIDIRSL